MEYPQYVHNPSDNTGTLTEEFRFSTPFFEYRYEDALVQLEKGVLTLREGFTWDYGSGPAIDTPSMVYGSLAHDALYYLMIHGAVPKNRRRDIDKYFKRLLARAGMGWFRRQYVYLAVRVGYPVARKLGML